MANFKDRVEALAGTVATDDLISTWLTSSVYDVINILPPQVLYIAGETENIYDDSGSTVPNSRILEVIRWGGDPRIENECREIDSALRGKATPTSGYLEEATDDSPVFWRRNNNIRVLPTPTESDFARVTYVNYPAVSWNHIHIPKFPDEVEHLVILKAAVKAKFYQIGLANKEEDIEVATSHTNHMSALNQEYTMAMQGFMSGFQINMPEQGVIA